VYEGAASTLHNRVAPFGSSPWPVHSGVSAALVMPRRGPERQSLLSRFHRAKCVPAPCTSPPSRGGVVKHQRCGKRLRQLRVTCHLEPPGRTSD